jgi:hypothetical protein
MSYSMPRWIGGAAVAFVLLLGGCATAYQPEGMTGGFNETSVSPDQWTIRFAGNGYTTLETVQTYWLYHCADFALSKGFDGFEIITPLNLSSQDRRPARDGAVWILAKGGGGGHGGGGVVVYSGGGAMVYKPQMIAQIRLLKSPFTPIPAHRFDAHKLKAMLEGPVNGPKCNGNVCPYVHRYLFPEVPPPPAPSTPPAAAPPPAPAPPATRS